MEGYRLPNRSETTWRTSAICERIGAGGPYLWCKGKEQWHKHVAPAQEDDVLVLFKLARQCVQGEYGDPGCEVEDGRLRGEESIMTWRIVAVFGQRSI